MAEIIPSLSSCINKMTSGEKRFARRIEALLEDDYLCWYDIPLGKKRRYPDFIILHPQRGLLFIEIKDWKLDNIKSINHQSVEYIDNNGLQIKANPLEQARQCTYTLINRLKQDPSLCNASGRYQGNLVLPYGYGVAFTNITKKALNNNDIYDLIPEHLIISKDEMSENVDAESFQKKLWSMFNVQFNTKLSLPQIDRIRWHLFPEIRITNIQSKMFADAETGESNIEENLPDIVKVMDLQQEQLARSMGEGHRVIHGVAGSGKTLILGYRSLYLSQLMQKPILVLCYNIALAAKLRSMMKDKGLLQQVHVYHFHDWCGEQVKRYHVKAPEYGGDYLDKIVETVISGVDKGQIPRGQYGAVLIDEGHDFQPEWLKLVVQMLDPETNSLLLLYDDAQSIYKANKGLDFSLSSVGIQARGRTTILNLNYRNTREIIKFAYNFAEEYINPTETDEDHVPIIQPESAGVSGPVPVYKQMQNLDEEIKYIIKCVLHWKSEGASWNDMAILYPANWLGDKLKAQLESANIPFCFLNQKKTKMNYDPALDQVAVLTLHSSKGLEFQTVIMMGVGHMNEEDTDLGNQARILYVGMTRAREKLLITSSSENKYTQKISKSLNSFIN